MLGPLAKAQLVAFLTKKLLDSPAFTNSVASLHGVVSNLQAQAYDALEAATREERPPLNARQQEHEQHQQQQQHHSPSSAAAPSESIKQQNDSLKKLIEKLNRDLEKGKK